RLLILFAPGVGALPKPIRHSAMCWAWQYHTIHLGRRSRVAQALPPVYLSYMNYEMRPITSEEVPEFLRTDAAGFFDTISEEAIERERPLLDLDTTLAAFHEGRIVATSGAYSFEITVPGPSRIPAAGLAWIAVHATHRRRGL